MFFLQELSIGRRSRWLGLAEEFQPRVSAVAQPEKLLCEMPTSHRGSSLYPHLLYFQSCSLVMVWGK